VVAENLGYRAAFLALGAFAAVAFIAALFARETAPARSRANAARA
jgi:hypothetical protein